MFSPVPEAVFGEEGSGLKHVELQQDLQDVERQKNPLRVGDQRILLIQADKHGIHQDDQVKGDNKAPEVKRIMQSIFCLFLGFLCDKWSCRELTGVGRLCRASGSASTRRNWGSDSEVGVASTST